MGGRDAQIGVLQDLSENAGIALGRALDLVAIHKLNPLAGTVSSLVTSGLIDTTKSATLANGKSDAAIETAVGLVIDAGFTPPALPWIRLCPSACPPCGTPPVGDCIRSWASARQSATLRA